MAVPTFNEWLKIKVNEITLGSDGTRDNAPAQTSAATSQVAQKWLGNDANSDRQGSLISKTGNRSVLGKDLLDIGAEAIDGAPNALAGQTTAPMVANFIQQNLGLPKVLNVPKPTQVKMMRKRMRKR